MRVKVLLQITTGDGAPGEMEEIASLTKRVDRPEDLGLSLAESKALLAGAQHRIVAAQTKAWAEGRRCCETCGRSRRSKGSYPLVFRTLFGDVRLASPRLHRCSCREGDGPATSSPLTELIPDHVAPERLYLETQSEAAWRAILDDLIARGLRTPEFVIVDGASGLEKALAALWPKVPAQRCTVHKHRNLLAHAPEPLHEEVSADYTDMIYAATPKEIEQRRRAFLRKWRLKCRAVADSLEEAGERLFTFTRLSPSQWKSARTTNAIERLHEEFKRRIKTQTVLPSAETAAMLFWALLASGQITMRKVDGWQTLAEKPAERTIDLAA